MPRVDGFDVSHYQIIDWSKVPKLPFMAAKATEGSSYADPTFARNWAGMRALGGRWRFAYHFIDGSAPQLQAQRFMNVVNAAGGLRTGEGIMLDVEGPALPTAFIESVLLEMQRLSGRTPLLYMGAFYPGSNDARLQRFPLWLPAYTNSKPYTVRPYAVWQWAQNGSIPGIYGNVDINQVDDPTTLDLLCANTVTPPPPPAPNPLPQRDLIGFGAHGRLVEIAQWELAVVSGAQFHDEIGDYKLHTAQAIINLGRILQRNWDGLTIGNEQWAAIDYLYIRKGHQPVLY